MTDFGNIVGSFDVINFISRDFCVNLHSVNAQLFLYVGKSHIFQGTIDTLAAQSSQSVALCH